MIALSKEEGYDGMVWWDKDTQFIADGKLGSESVREKSEIKQNK